jgi:hypothetical protein
MGVVVGQVLLLLFESSNFFSFFFSNRDKTSMPVLREMLPEDVVNYCQEHRLLDTVVSPERGPHRSPEQHPVAHRYQHSQQQHYAYDPLNP